MIIVSKMRSLSQPFAYAALVALLAGGALTWRLSAQGQPPTTAGQDAAAQEPTIRVSVDLVNILFTVKTKKGGQLVPNLTKDDFRIYEDGKEQTIKRFSKET